MARNGTDLQQVALPSDGIYGMQIAVRSVSSAELTDTSRAGLARGNLVIPSTIGTAAVPEFGYLVQVAMVTGMVYTVIVFRKFFYRY